MSRRDPELQKWLAGGSGAELRARLIADCELVPDAPDRRGEFVTRGRPFLPLDDRGRAEAAREARCHRPPRVAREG